MRGASNTTYVNREQSPKPSPEEVTQAGITRAFTHKQRTSKYVFTRAKHKYVLLSGKHTGRAGITGVRIQSGEMVDVTDLERTLIDIAVRPAYSGGIESVAKFYNRFANKVNVDHLINLLKRFGHAYPHHQSIGFLLQRAGRSGVDCRRFASLGSNFDFYLDYDMKHPAYDQEWRLYYPQSLNRVRVPRKA